MRIKKYLPGLALFAICATLCPVVLTAQETPEAQPAQPPEEKPLIKPFTSFGLTFSSKYVWRGLELSRDSLVVFPSITVGVDAGKYGSIGLNMWGDFDFNYRNPIAPEFGQATWWETDWVLTYSNYIPFSPDTKLNWTFGFINYDVDGGKDRELFVVLGFVNPQVNKIVTPSISIWRGVYIDPPATYVNLAFARSFAMDRLSPRVKGWTVDLAAAFGHYNIPSSDPALDYSNWHDGLLTAGVTIPIKSWAAVSPAVNYSFPMSTAAHEMFHGTSFYGTGSHYVFGSLTWKMNF